MWTVYSGEVRGEVGTRSRMCCVGWTVWVQGGSAIRCTSKLIIVRSMVTYYLCCRNYMYIYKYIYLFIYKLSVYVHIISTNIR